MIRSLFTASTGMDAQQTTMDVIANNLANVNTTGFKASRVDFQDILYQTQRAAGTPDAQSTEIPTGIQIGLGTRAASVQKIMTQGDVQTTGNQFDTVIQGNGFFQVMLPSGTYGYTRDGSFKMDSTGRLVTSDGYPIWPEVTIPAAATSVTIGSDGTVSAAVTGQSQPQTLGSLKIVTFQNPAGLSNMGSNLMTQTAASGNPVEDTPGQNGSGTLSQGFLEMSNVQIVQEMVNMIVAQRAYEANSKSIQTADQMLSIANQLRQ